MCVKPLPGAGRNLVLEVEAGGKDEPSRYILDGKFAFAAGGQSPVVARI
jgi:hypothetical protein